MSGSHRRGTLTAAGLLTAAFFAGGCDAVPGNRFRETQRELQATREENQQLKAQIGQQQSQIRELQSTLLNVQGQEGDVLSQLVVPARVELANLSGGYSEEGQTGHAGVVLYIQPMDKDGTVIKWPGSLRVRVIDPFAPADRNVVAECSYPASESLSLWYGRLWTNHFTIKCPWLEGKAPQHEELTAAVEYVPLLTGQTLTTQKQIKITLHPDLATRPAQ